LNFYWNLGKETNNKVEAYALLKGIQLEKHRQIQTLNAVGDSKTIIRIMILGSDPKNLSLKRVIDRICLFSRTLKVNYFHVLRGNNVEADKMANLAIGKPPGTLGVDDEECIPPPPPPPLMIVATNMTRALFALGLSGGKHRTRM
jgi:ribonuclease HI